MDRLPLEDIQILDLSWVMAGPHATHLFLDLGAKIVKVESKRSLDVVRTNTLRKGVEDYRQEGGWAFNDLNNGKQEIAINLKSVKGREALEDLVRQSDIVVANYGTSAFHKLGLTFEDLSKIKSDIIVLNASGLGDWGPYASYVSFAPVVQALTGMVSRIGYEGDKTPYDGYPPLCDYLGGLAIATNLMAAIEDRDRTGKGQFIDLSQVESAASYLGPALLDYQVNDHIEALAGNHHYAGSAAPHNAYRCKGEDKLRQWCVIAVASQEEWERFCQVVDPQGTWTAEAKFSTMEERVAHQEELDAKVETWTLQHTQNEVAELLQGNRVSAAPVQYAADLLYKDPQMQDRAFFREVVFPPSDRTPPTLLVTGPKMRISGLDYDRQVKPGPCVGQDTQYVLRELLGKSDEWIAEGMAEGAFE